MDSCNVSDLSVDLHVVGLEQGAFCHEPNHGLGRLMAVRKIHRVREPRCVNRRKYSHEEQE